METNGFQRGFLLFKDKPTRSKRRPNKKKSTVTSANTAQVGSNDLPEKQSRAKDGFKRGFLISQDKPSRSSRQSTSKKTLSSLATKTKTKVISNDLLSFEEQEPRRQETPLLVVSDERNVMEDATPGQDEQETAMLPLHLSLDDYNDFRIEAVSTTRKEGPLIQEVQKSSKQQHMSRSHGSDHHLQSPTSLLSARETKPIIREVDSEGSKPKSLIKKMLPDAQDVSEEIHASSLSTPIQFVEDSEDSGTVAIAPGEKNAIPVPKANAPAIEEHGSSDLSSLSMELSRVLWQLRRGRKASTKKESSATVIQFVENHLHCESQWVYTWDAILEVYAQECQSGTSAPEVQLGMIMLEQQPEGLGTLVSFLLPTLEKRSRVVALGAVLLLQCWFQHSQQKEHAQLIVLLDIVLPRLTDLVVDSVTANKRTVLSHWCMSASYEIVTVASKQACQTNEPNLLQSVWKVLDLLEKQWEVQRNWLVKGNSSLANDINNSSSVTAVASADVARRQCTLAVLADWKRTTKHCQIEYQDLLLLEDQAPGKAVVHVAHFWCGQVSGVHINGIDGFDIGSLSQCLCSHDDKIMTPANVVASLEDAVKLMQSASEEKNKQKSEMFEYNQRAILRGVTAWLGQSKKHFRSLAKTRTAVDSNNTSSATSASTESTPSMLERAMELSMNLLRSKSSECTDMLLAILNYLWSDSEGLPPDLFEAGAMDTAEISDMIPPSFGLMIDELRSTTLSGQESSKELDPSAKALCILISRCILRKGTYLLTALVSRNGISKSTVEVLAMILIAEGSIKGTVDANAMDDTEGVAVSEHGFLSIEAGKILLENIQSNAFVCQKLRSAPELLSGFPLEFTVPKLLEALADGLRDTSSKEDALTSTVATCLTCIMETNLAKADKLVSRMVDTLIRVEEKFSSDSNKTIGPAGPKQQPKDVVGKLCANFAGNWRRSLLTNSICGDQGFANIMAVIGKAMFAMPSNAVPLTLLGSLLGDGTALQELEGIGRRRVHFATTALLKLSLDEMQSRADHKGDESMDGVDGKRDDSILFRQLSPLLLLRRIPSSYFRVAFQANDTVPKGDHENFLRLLDTLCSQLALRLDIEDQVAAEKPEFTADERRLAAEIAGRCLPFYLPSHVKDQSSPCCFDRICVPAFGSALRALTTSESQTTSESPTTSESQTTKESKTKAVRTARAALYAACLHVPLADSKDDGEGVLAVASFAVNVLSVETNAEVEDFEDDCDEDVIQLQTGCIDFFAICLESTLQRRLDQRSGTSGRFVTEASQSSGGPFQEKSESLDTPNSTLDALNNISCTLVTILRAGTSSRSWIQLYRASFGAFVLNTSEPFSPSARTCLWNSFLVTSQRIPEQDGKLNSWARTTLPWIVDWGYGGRVDLGLRHPLCMAAALQVTFVLITRTKSFDCLALQASSKEGAVRKAYKWALESVKCNFRDGGVYAGATMRMAGLKLMLAFVSIDQIVSDQGTRAWQGCLSPGELGESFSVLQGAANMDADSNVRKLASHVLGAMKMAR